MLPLHQNAACIPALLLKYAFRLTCSLRVCVSVCMCYVVFNISSYSKYHICRLQRLEYWAHTPFQWLWMCVHNKSTISFHVSFTYTHSHMHIIHSIFRTFLVVRFAVSVSFSVVWFVLFLFHYVCMFTFTLFCCRIASMPMNSHFKPQFFLYFFWSLHSTESIIIELSRSLTISFCRSFSEYMAWKTYQNETLRSTRFIILYSIKCCLVQNCE